MSTRQVTRQKLFDRRFAARSPSLPHPDYPPEIKQIIVRACHIAWLRTKKSLEGLDLALSDLEEDEITLQLQNHLNDMRETPDPDVPGFSAQWFSNVNRDAKTVNYNGISIRKMPDLVFRLHHVHPGMSFTDHYGLYTECKVIASGKQSVGNYCDDGLRRYVQGDYAWAMRSGLMVAYLMDPDRHDVSKTLIPKLRKAQKQTPDPYATRALPEHRNAYVARVYTSVHARGWSYPTGTSPGDIELLHLWLR